MAELTTDAFGTTSELDPSAFGTTPTEAKKPEGDYLRGLKKYAPQMQEMYGAGKALAGKAIDSESLIKSGIATMQDANRKVQEIGTKPTDEWTGVNSVGDAIDWAQHGLGQVTGNLAESAVAAGAGTLLGGLGANPLTAAAGGVTGLLGKSIVKGALKDQAEAIAAKYGAQEAEKFIAKGMAEDVAKKTIGRTIGQNVGIAGMAGFHGVGETGSRAFQEAGYDPSQVELGQVLPRAAGHAAAEFLGDKILLGGMLGKGAYRAAGEGAYPMVKTVAGNMAIVAGKEIPVELVQTVLERDAAKLELMSPEARDEYINTVAQTFLFGIAGAPAGVRSYLSGKRATEPLPTPAPVTPEQTAQQKILNTELGGATDAFVRNIPSEQKLLPPGVITVPNNAGGETVIDANAGPIQGAAVAAVTNSTIAEDIASGIPLKGYAPDQAKAELASRPDAERYEIRPHPVSGDRGRVAIVPKSAQALAEIDAKASSGNEAMARSEQLAAEEGARKQLAQVAKDIQAAQKQAIDLHRSAASIEKSITPSTPPQDAAIAREQATELRSQAAAIQTQIQTARAAATQQATQGVRQQAAQNAPATEQALAQDAAQQELAPAVAQPVANIPTNPVTNVQSKSSAPRSAAPLALYTDGVEGNEIPASAVPNGNEAFQYALGRTKEKGPVAIFRRKASERGTYGGWRWERDAQPAGKASTRRAGESESDWLYRKAAEKNKAKAEQQRPSEPVSEVDAKDLEVVGRAVTPTGDLGLSIIREDAMPDMDKAGPKEVSKQSATFLRHVAKLFGKEIVFVGGMNEDGFYQSGNKIYLSTKSNINQLRVLGHEMLHALKRQNRASYDKLLEAVGAIATDAQLKAQFKDYFALDAEMSQKTDAEIDAWLKDKANRDMVLEEMMADLSGNRFAESAFWESVFTKIDAKYGSEQSKGIIAKLRLALVAALNKLMSLVKGGQFSVDARVSEHLESIREALATGFADYAKAVKDGQIFEDGAGEAKFARKAAEDRKNRTLDEVRSRIGSDYDLTVAKNPRKMVDGKPFTTESVNVDALGPGLLIKDADAAMRQMMDEAIAESGLPANLAKDLRPPTSAYVEKALKLTNGSRFWYELSSTGFAGRFFRLPVLMAERLIDIVAGTSGGQEPTDNLKIAVAAMAQDMQSLPVTTGVRDPSSLTGALSPDALTTHKFGNFSDTMQLLANLRPGVEPLPTVDLQMAAVFGIRHAEVASNPVMYETISRFLIKLRDAQNAAQQAGSQPYESWQMQALLWVAERNTSDPDSYDIGMPRIVAQLQAAGIPTPGGRITQETLMDPRTPEVLSPTTKYVPEAPVMTIETRTQLSKVGVSSTEVFNKIKNIQAPWAKKLSGEFEAIQRRTMRALGFKQPHPKGLSTKQPSVISQLMSVVMGKTMASWDAVRVDTNGFGTFEGDASPNLRVPMMLGQRGGSDGKGGTPRFLLDAEQRKQVASVVGKDFKQKAMADSQFITVPLGQHDTFSIFVKRYDKVDITETELAQISDGLGRPLNYSQVPNGWLLDVNIGGFDETPQQKAENRDVQRVRAVMLGVEKSQGQTYDWHELPRSYDSDYIDKSEYNKHIKGLENAITRNTNPGRRGKAGNPEQRASDLARLREQLQGIYKQQESAFRQWEREARDTAAKRGVKLSPARSDAAGNERAGGRAAGDGEAVQLASYGTPATGAVSAQGFHYSGAERKQLDGRYYGTGAKGREAPRVFAAEDKRLRERIYFYVDAGKGITPEQGVGAHSHTVNLNNLYDANQESWIQRQVNNDNDFESAVIDNGFDGYVVDFGTQRAAVLIGRHSVPVTYVGSGKQTGAVNASETPKKRTDLPLGQMTGAEWKKLEPRATDLEDGKSYYRSDLKFSPARVQSENELPNQQPGNRTLDGAELKALRRAASRLERPADAVFLRVTEDGRAIATGPKGVRVPEIFTRFAKDNDLTFEARRNGEGRNNPSGYPTGYVASNSEPMPVEYREAGAQYFGEGNLSFDRTGKTRFSPAREYISEIEGRIAKIKASDNQGGLSMVEANLANIKRGLAGEIVRDEQGNLLAPNGRKSKLTEKQYLQVRTPAFRKWFGDWLSFHNAKNGDGVWVDVDKAVSKIVDENGEPKVVYHGTEKGGFTTMRPEAGDKHRSPMLFAAATWQTARTYSWKGDEIDLAQAEFAGAVARKIGNDWFVVQKSGDSSEAYNVYGELVDVEQAEGYVSKKEAEYFRDNELEQYLRDRGEVQAGIYSMFLNIRDPIERDFEGANWDGNTNDMFEVLGEDGDNIYADDGRRLMPQDEAEALAEQNEGAEVSSVEWIGETTNTVAEEAKQYGQDGAIIRQVEDDGGRYPGGVLRPDDVFVFFDSNQAKSATQNTGAFSQKNDDLRYSPPRWYFSPLEKAFESAPDRVFTTAPQLKLWLAGNKAKLGLKDDEIFWTGINDYLDLMGKTKVSKADVLGYLAQNGVQVEEVEKGGKLEGEALDQALRSADLLGFDTLREARAAYREAPQNYDLSDADTGVSTKYGEYVLPGGENYRELLLTLPGARNSTDAEIAKLQTELRNARGARASELISKLEALRQGRNSGALQNEYRSGHWTEANILAHVRFNDRIDADGNKVLFIEEVQGDWQQSYRKQVDAISRAVDNDFLKIVERMKKDGVLEVECD